MFDFRKMIKLRSDSLEPFDDARAPWLPFFSSFARTIFGHSIRGNRRKDAHKK